LGRDLDPAARRRVEPRQLAVRVEAREPVVHAGDPGRPPAQAPARQADAEQVARAAQGIESDLVDPSSNGLGIEPAGGHDAYVEVTASTPPVVTPDDSDSFPERPPAAATTVGCRGAEPLLTWPPT